MIESNDITRLVEESLKTKITTAVYPWSIPVYLSDESAMKGDMPYIVIHVENGTEYQGAPGSGIFNVVADILFRSHLKTETPEDRSAVIVAMNNIAYSNAAVELSNDNLTVYGFIPEATGAITANVELKAYEYRSKWRIICTPTA